MREVRPAGQSVVTGVVLGGVALACLAAGPGAISVLLLVLCVVAAGELFRLARTRGIVAVPLVAFAGIGALFAVAYARGERAPAVFPAVVAATVGLAFLAMLARRRRTNVTHGVAVTVFATVYLGVLGSYVVVLRKGPGGFRVTLAFGLMAVLHDAGTFLAGRARGRRALAPSVSPDRTWEGWLGGTALTAVVGVAAALWLDPPFTWTTALVLAALVSAAAPLGDLFESMLKRDLGAKDAGSILPVHGGVLDRIDSVVAAAPVFFYAYRVLAH